VNVTFTVDSIPVAQPRQRIASKARGGAPLPFPRAYTPTDHPVNAFKACVKAAASGLFDAPTNDPVECFLVFVMPRPSKMNWKKRPTPRAANFNKKNDCDNLAKSVLDALTGIAWNDDGQVYRLFIEKWIAAGDEKPHVEITIAYGAEEKPGQG